MRCNNLFCLWSMLCADEGLRNVTTIHAIGTSTAHGQRTDGSTHLYFLMILLLFAVKKSICRYISNTTNFSINSNTVPVVNAFAAVVC